MMSLLVNAIDGCQGRRRYRAVITSGREVMITAGYYFQPYYIHHYYYRIGRHWGRRHGRCRQSDAVIIMASRLPG